MLFFIVLFIFIRSLNFAEHLNFSFDQAWGATRVMQIWKEKEFTLVGPGSSIVVKGKQILQGSINYYFYLIFLLLGNFDPIISSYLFMLFAAVMVIPLFYGVRLLINQKTAIFVLVVYSLLPLYIDFTRFFFGPNYQFTLIPLLVYFMGLYRKREKTIHLLLVFFMIGILSQFHYATLILFPLLFSYYYFNLRTEPVKLYRLIFISSTGFLIGFSPIILFEIKNNFYNLKVLFEYFKYSRNIGNFALLPHRYLSLSLLLLIFIAGSFKKKITDILIFTFFFLLLFLDLFIYLPKPKQAFGMAKNWNYLMEKKAYEFIKKENLKDFNIVNLIYDNLSVAIKYQMKKEGTVINYDDYYHNKYLFVINNDENIFSNPAYEVNTFKPNKKLKQWKLNDYYNLYLFERLKT